MLLEKKNAIIYGAGGSLGAAVAKKFAAEGARVFLAGRTKETLAAVAAEIGEKAEVDVVDALDERAIDEHAASVVERGGSIDVSLNLITRGDVQGIPLLDMSPGDLVECIVNGVTANFLTARAAGRQMVRQGHGTILGLNSGSAQGSPMMGGTGLADAATDTLIRNLAIELGPAGVRVLGLWVAGVPETLTVEKLSKVNANITAEAVQGILDNLAGMRLTKRSPRIDEVAATIAFLASDQAAGITGTMVNVTSMFTS
ncbi:SDR family NAD(P)-dependent oxidoreductase [Fodinicola acaciae]|uniref:SDR family NAD(P)-dependent oxidoreductase n=1 Tax=Fodinicola acaciae TaxID=2681555 RepID=UPI0013D204A7|nr:SDR family oxidoreductase [Fodinicola acaciae]